MNFDNDVYELRNVTHATPARWVDRSKLRSYFSSFISCKVMAILVDLFYFSYRQKFHRWIGHAWKPYSTPELNVMLYLVDLYRTWVMAVSIFDKDGCRALSWILLSSVGLPTMVHWWSYVPSNYVLIWCIVAILIFRTFDLKLLNHAYFILNNFLSSKPCRTRIIDGENPTTSFRCTGDGKRKRKGELTAHTESQVGYISAIWEADPFGPISTEIGAVVEVDDVIIQSNIFRGFRSIGGEFPFSHLPCWSSLLLSVPRSLRDATASTGVRTPVMWWMHACTASVIRDNSSLAQYYSHLLRTQSFCNR